MAQWSVGAHLPRICSPGSFASAGRRGKACCRSETRFRNWTCASTDGAAGWLSFHSDRPFRRLATVPSNILQDQRDIFLFPSFLQKSQRDATSVRPLSVSAGTAGFVVGDLHAALTFRATNSFDRFNHVFRSTNTAVFIIAVPC